MCLGFQHKPLALRSSFILLALAQGQCFTKHVLPQVGSQRCASNTVSLKDKRAHKTQPKSAIYKMKEMTQTSGFSKPTTHFHSIYPFSQSDEYGRPTIRDGFCVGKQLGIVLGPTFFRQNWWNGKETDKKSTKKNHKLFSFHPIWPA